MDGPSPVGALEIPALSRTEREFVHRMASKAGGVSAAELADGLNVALVSVPVLMRRLRKKLGPYGWTIPAAKTGRGNLAIYRLEPVRTA
jgi:DNA-binding CsgD family transcriptional regulator